MNLTKNIVHSSDKPERAIYELSVLFTSEEYISYDLINQIWVQ
ncbi:MAG: hypothetical protein ACTSQ9_01725 [Candidatus Hodarchaeales archaeon]